MLEPLKLLVIEDSDMDTELLIRELRLGGFAPEFERVDTAEAMAKALERPDWHLVVSDYALPQFSGSSALSLFKARQLDIPFIIVSGALGEERAVEMMKAGAH